MFEPKAEPFLRWLGGKRKFVPQLAEPIAEYLDNTGGHYIEPFVGGAAMALALGRTKTVINDAIPDLSRLYTALRDERDELKELLCYMRDFGSESDHYYSIRETEPDTDVEAGARMVYLNAHCFNGLWRTNKSGKMNAAYGHKPDRITDALLDRLDAAHEALQRMEIFNGDFECIVNAAEKGDLLYVDPPYDGTFVGYAEGGFNGASQDRIGSALHQAHQRGVAFICHNADTEKVRNWFGYANILTASELRAVNRVAAGRGEKKCLLISNKPELLLGYLA